MTPDEMRAYILASREAMPTDRAGHAETEHLADGRCYECGRRGHTHFTCPGAVVEEPVIRRLIPVDAPILGPWED